MYNLSTNEEKISFLEDLKLKLEQNILYNASTAGVDPADIEINDIVIEDYFQTIPENISQTEHIAFVSMARSISKLYKVNKKIEELKNA